MRRRFQAPHTRKKLEAGCQAAARAAYVVMCSCFAATCRDVQQMGGEQSSLNFRAAPGPLEAAWRAIGKMCKIFFCEPISPLQLLSLDNLIAPCRGSHWIWAANELQSRAVSQLWPALASLASCLAISARTSSSKLVEMCQP